MTQDQYIVRRKPNILKLGETRGNISEACLTRPRYLYAVDAIAITANNLNRFHTT